MAFSLAISSSISSCRWGKHMRKQDKKRGHADKVKSIIIIWPPDPKQIPGLFYILTGIIVRGSEPGLNSDHILIVCKMIWLTSRTPRAWLQSSFSLFNFFWNDFNHANRTRLRTRLRLPRILVRSAAVSESISEHSDVAGWPVHSTWIRWIRSPNSLGVALPQKAQPSLSISVSFVFAMMSKMRPKHTQ